MIAHVLPLSQNIVRLPTRKSRIAIHLQDVIRFIHLNEICFLQADGNYTRFFMENGAKILSAQTLKKYESFFTVEGFLRIHNSYMINPNFITSVDKRNDYTVIVNENNTIPTSRSKRHILMEYLDGFSVH